MMKWFGRGREEKQNQRLLTGIFERWSRTKRTDKKKMDLFGRTPKMVALENFKEKVKRL